MNFIDIVLHLDVYLAQWSSAMGPLLYVLLFAIIFCETGLVVTPFLPGDSLLFATGAIAALESSGLDIYLLFVLLVSAAFLGDNTNYQIGKLLGPKVFKNKEAKFFNPKYLHQTNDFYNKHGGKTVLLARFLPIFRTFAPFIAGVGAMRRFKFMSYSFFGSLVWIGVFLFAGFKFGNISSVKRNFHVVIFAVVLISFAPVIVGAIKHRKQAQKN